MAEQHFDVDAAAPVEAGDVTFTLAGRTWHCRTRNDVDYITIEGLLTRESTGLLKDVVVQVGPFFDGVLMPEEAADFREVLNTPGAVTWKGVFALIDFLVEKVLGFPTQAAAGSSTGSGSTAKKSRAASSSRAARSRKSAA